MLSAVHSDRSGRLVVADDYAAASWDGAAVHPLANAIALPSGSEVLPLAGRAAIGLDRTGRPRALGTGRWAVGAVLPAGYLRTALPAYEDDANVSLAPRAYTAIGAGPNGDLVAAAATLEPAAVDMDGRASSDLAARVSAGLRDRPSSRLLRQLARCAREYRCRAAANAFVNRHDCALPIEAPPNERPPEGVALHDDAEAMPTEPAAFKPTPEDIADVAVALLESGGTIVAFGRECEGEPLLAARTVEAAIVAIRKRTSRGTIHLETNGSDAIALRRLCEAGLDSAALRITSARPATFEALQRPDGFRLADVRTALAEAVAQKTGVALLVLALPGLTDRPSELDALVELTAELPAGSSLLLRNLAADPGRALHFARSVEPPLGMELALARLRAEAVHLRIAAHPSPLVRT